MRFTLSNGDAISARQAWHEAFMTGVSAMDPKEAINNFNVQFSSKGSDNCTMDHCDKGKIQQVIYKLQIQKPLAWAWGMHAYSPTGTINQSILTNALFPYVMNSISTDKFNPFQHPEAGILAFVAIQDSAIETRSGLRASRKVASLIKCPPEIYKKKWARRFRKMKDCLKDLDGDCLPPVAHVVGLLNDKAIGSYSAIADLARMLKTTDLGIY